MKQIEFDAELQGNTSLTIPSDLAAEMNGTGRAKVTITVPESDSPETDKKPALPQPTPLYGMAALFVVSVVQYEPLVKLSMQVIISLGVFGAALYVLLSERFKRDQVRVKFAIAGISSVLSFWLGKTV